jgi:hypothetical protein
MKDCVLVFFKIMLVMWWLILGSIITVATFSAPNWYMALIGLFILSVWVSLSAAAVYWKNKTI